MKGKERKRKGKERKRMQRKESKCKKGKAKECKGHVKEMLVSQPIRMQWEYEGNAKGVDSFTKQYAKEMPRF